MTGTSSFDDVTPGRSCGCSWCRSKSDAALPTKASCYTLGISGIVSAFDAVIGVSGLPTDEAA
jgi:hypothetical protein